MSEANPALRRAGTGEIWLTALRWTEPVKHRLPAGPHRRDIAVSVTVSQGKGTRRLRRHGSRQLPARYRREALFSLALAFCHRYRNGYGIFRVTEQRWLFLASQDGLPAVAGDVDGSPEAVTAARDLFLSLNDPPESGWEYEALPDSPEDWTALVQTLSARQRAGLRVRVQGAPPRAALPLAALVAVAGVTAFWLSQNREPDVLPPEAVAARAQALAGDAPPAPSLPSPWADTAPAREAVRRCESAWRGVPVSAGGWLLKSGRCDAGGLLLQWTWLPGGTAASLTAALARHWPETAPVIDLVNGAQTATLLLPVTFTPGRDEAVPGPEAQLSRMASAFQRQGLTVPFEDISPPEPEPDENGIIPPALPWRAFAFTLTGPDRPSVLIGRTDDTGLRIQSLSFSLNGPAVSYTTEGLIYASR